MTEELMRLFLLLDDEEKDEVIEYIKTLPLNCGECKKKGVGKRYTWNEKDLI